MKPRREERPTGKFSQKGLTDFSEQVLNLEGPVNFAHILCGILKRDSSETGIVYPKD
jgi:hypothetical protein